MTANGPWETHLGQPIVIAIRPTNGYEVEYQLREHAAHHGDTAWLHPAITAYRDELGSLAKGMLDAIGAVGLSKPRTYGEAHLLRPLTHLIHGPVRHLIIDDVNLLHAEVLSEVHEACLISHTQLWLIVDVANPVVGHRNTRARELFDWLDDACHIETQQTAMNWWQHRTTSHPHCHPPEPTWWHQPLDHTQPLPAGCPDHRNELGSGHIECLLAWTRRGLTAGHLAPGIARRRLTEYQDHPATTAIDTWALRAAGRDFYTPGTDALRRTHASAETLTLEDVTPDGTTITADGTQHTVTPEMRPAVARLRTSRRLAGCLDHEPMFGMFDQVPGLNPRRR